MESKEDVAHKGETIHKVIFAIAGIILFLFPFTWLECAALASLVLIARGVMPFSDCDMTLMFFKIFGKGDSAVSGKVVWVTGASSGLGEALAIRLARAKTKLVLSARSEENLQRVKGRCIAESGLSESDVLVLPLDILQCEKHESSLETVLKRFGKLDILVSNAGKSQRAHWEDIEVQVDRDLLELNVFSLVNLARVCTRYFDKVGGGQHVVTSSTAGKMGAPLSGSYTGSKYALMGYFECLRFEKGPKMPITLLCVGPAESKLTLHCFTAKVGKECGVDRSGRMLSGERFAELAFASIANELGEVWIVLQPMLTLNYISQYCPTLFKWTMGFFDVKKMATLRDGRNDLASREKSN